MMDMISDNPMTSLLIGFLVLEIIFYAIAFVVIVYAIKPFTIYDYNEKGEKEGINYKKVAYVSLIGPAIPFVGFLAYGAWNFYENEVFLSVFH